MKYTITAVIPVAQYANLQPSIEVEAETFEAANALVMPHIQTIWDIYGEKPLVAKNVIASTSQRKLVECFVGGSIFYDDAAHSYTNEKGEVYLSGSVYAQQFAKPFNAEMIAGVMAKKWGVEGKDIQDMWKLKGEVSMSLGTTLHAALELYGKYGNLCKSIEKDTHLHDNTYLRNAVETFYAGRENETAEYEIFVVDHAKKQVGQIDRLLVTGPMTGRIQDFKTTAEAIKPDKLVVYWAQLKFYVGVMQAAGWTIEGLDLFVWNGKWTTISKEASKEMQNGWHKIF